MFALRNTPISVGLSALTATVGAVFGRGESGVAGVGCFGGCTGMEDRLGLCEHGGDELVPVVERPGFQELLRGLRGDLVRDTRTDERRGHGFPEGLAWSWPILAGKGLDQGLDPAVEPVVNHHGFASVRACASRSALRLIVYALNSSICSSRRRSLAETPGVALTSFWLLASSFRLQSVERK